ncbi:hypothetical protein RhiJN_25306 [Ceratobasidium sp. AG-Ba]|nr:hypothetical protein RhiJN_25306 [Ceratobasidium sp. AG-Ba]
MAENANPNNDTQVVIDHLQVLPGLVQELQEALNAFQNLNTLPQQSQELQVTEQQMQGLIQQAAQQEIQGVQHEIQEGMQELQQQIQEVQQVVDQIFAGQVALQQALKAMLVDQGRAIARTFNLTVTSYNSTLMPLPLDDGDNPAEFPGTLPEFFTMTSKRTLLPQFIRLSFCSSSVRCFTYPLWVAWEWATGCSSFETGEIHRS